MAHAQQKNYLLRIKKEYPEKFKKCSVLDIGSLDINGNNRFLFEESTYLGIDLGPGKNVDVVCPGHLFKSENKFDIVISTECFEHDAFYKETILNAIDLTKSGGVFVFTCASTGRPVHGTSKAHPGVSPFTNDYYKNLTEEDIREFLDVESFFLEHKFEYNPISRDLYFFGIKK